MKKISRALKKWKHFDPSEKLNKVDYGMKQFIDACDQTDVDLHIKPHELFEIMRGKFFEVFLEEKKFSIFGLGILRLVFSCGKISKNDDRIKTETGVILSDVSSSTSRHATAGIIRCDEKELEKMLGI